MHGNTRDVAEHIIGVLGDCLISARLLEVCIEDLDRAKQCARWSLQSDLNWRTSPFHSGDIDARLKILIDQYYLSDLAGKKQLKETRFRETQNVITLQPDSFHDLSTECVVGLGYLRADVGRSTVYDDKLNESKIFSGLIEFSKNEIRCKKSTRAELEAAIWEEYEGDVAFQLWNSWWPVLTKRMWDIGTLHA